MMFTTKNSQVLSIIKARFISPLQTQVRGLRRQRKIEEDRTENTPVESASIETFRTAKPENEIVEKHSVLDAIDPKDPPDLVPDFLPTFNFSAYVNKSELLQQFIKLGVDLSRIEKRKGLPQFVLKLDFEKDVKNHLIFLNDIGVEPSAMGEFITKNPLIFKEDIDHLQTRVNYLQAKKFEDQQISRVVTKNPFWLMFPTKRIDNRLGFFQQNFALSGNEVRFLAVKQPRLITYSLQHVKDSAFCIKEEMGFNKDEMKCLLLSKPKLWMLEPNELLERFDYVHRVMNLSHEEIVRCTELLVSRRFRVKQRHEFLKLLGRAQYDPSKDLYISLKSLVEGTDLEFVTNVAKSNIHTYDTFLRTM